MNSCKLGEGATFFRAWPTLWPIEQKDRKPHCFVIFNATAEPKRCSPRRCNGWVTGHDQYHYLDSVEILWSFHAAALICTYCPFISRPSGVHHSCPTGSLLLTFCKTRGLSRVRQAELALLPAAIVTDQGVVGLFDVHIVANAEHVTGSLDVWQQSQRKEHDHSAIPIQG